MKCKNIFKHLLLALPFVAAPACSVMTSGWSISSSYIWRIYDSRSYSFTKGSAAKIIELDRTIENRQASITIHNSLTNKFTFKAACMYQSATPAFELHVPTLDISVNDKIRGFSFARFLVDRGREYSLRAQVVAPSRLVFAPITAPQKRALSDLYLQLAEGGKLTIGLLQGKGFKPRIYTIPLEGFLEYSKIVLNDCVRLNSIAQNHRGEVKLLPDYITKEPVDAVEKDFSLKPKIPSDGLAKDEEETPAVDSVVEPAKEEQKEPELKLFTPGGEEASIGEDGKPITETPKEESLGTATEMAIDSDGNAVKNSSN